MKHLRRFDESKNDSLNDILKKISSKIDIAELKKVLDPYKETLTKIAAKYTRNGVIDSRLILNKVDVNERVLDDIIMFGVRLINLPINIVRIIIHFFSNLNLMRLGHLAIVAVFVLVLGLYINDAVDTYQNGISVGICNGVEFIPEHIEVTEHTYTNSKGEEETYTTEETIPDTWKAEVREFTGRVERWTTTDRTAGTSIDKDSVAKKINWQWEATIKRGAKKGGGFSGGGAGGSY